MLLNAGTNPLGIKAQVPLVSARGRGVLPKILGGGVAHSSQNPDPISDQNI